MLSVPRWYGRAACRGMATDLFYSCMSPVNRARAKAVCASCPVITECLDRAMDEEASDQSPTQNMKNRYGVRGGLSAGERWALAYPEEARQALDQEASRTRGRPSRVAADISDLAIGAVA